jgi:sialic acid synthase SpsE
MPHDLDDMRIGPHVIDAGGPTLVIADIDCVFGPALVDAAASAGVAAISLAATGAAFGDLTASALLARRAQALGLTVIAAPTSGSAVEGLERIGVHAYRIDSADITWEGLIRRCAQTGKPMLLGTGMTSFDDIRRAVQWARESGASGVALLHTISTGPAGERRGNLRAMVTLGLASDAVVGVADFSADGFAAPLAVALGASIYARTLTPRSGAEPVATRIAAAAAEFALIVREIARAELALGSSGLPFVQAGGTRLASQLRSPR